MGRRHIPRCGRNTITALFQLPKVASILRTLITSLCTMLASDAIADSRNVCDIAARHAAKASGVPLSVLFSITRTETGRSRDGVLSPWPWTVNMEGVGRWFDTQHAALSYVMRHFDRGARSFDVGCFQINYRWHGENFASIDEMFDPRENALYAARFLKSLFAETGDWSQAAGAYHSRTPKYANRYIARFDKIRSHMVPADVGRSTSLRMAAVAGWANTFPLLKAGRGQSALGSLMPRNAAQLRPMIAFQSDKADG